MTYLIRSLAATYFDRHHIEPHAHRWGQLVYAATGVMRVRSGETLWLIPPAQAVWAPAGVTHEIWARGEIAMRTLYFAPRFASVLPSACRSIEITPLLREAIIDIVARGMLDAKIARERRLAFFVMDQVRHAVELPLNLPLPKDPRALRIADWLRENPASGSELAELAPLAGASSRTVQRLFLQDTGLRFSEWRQRLRLIHAAGLIGAGMSVTNAGLDAGYASASAFIAAFRSRFGCTPARFSAQLLPPQPPTALS